MAANGGAYSGFGDLSKPIGSKNPSGNLTPLRVLDAGDLRTVAQSYTHAVAEGKIPNHTLINRTVRLTSAGAGVEKLLYFLVDSDRTVFVFAVVNGWFYFRDTDWVKPTLIYGSCHTHLWGNFGVYFLICQNRILKNCRQWMRARFKLGG